MCDPTQETAGDDALRNAGVRSILIISWKHSKIKEKKYFHLETWWHIFREHFMLASYASADLRAFLGDGNRSILSSRLKKALKIACWHLFGYKVSMQPGSGAVKSLLFDLLKLARYLAWHLSFITYESNGVACVTIPGWSNPISGLMGIVLLCSSLMRRICFANDGKKVRVWLLRSPLEWDNDPHRHTLFNVDNASLFRLHSWWYNLAMRKHWHDSEGTFFAIQKKRFVNKVLRSLLYLIESWWFIGFVQANF